MKVRKTLVAKSVFRGVAMVWSREFERTTMKRVIATAALAVAVASLSTGLPASTLAGSMGDGL